MEIVRKVFEKIAILISRVSEGPPFLELESHPPGTDLWCVNLNAE